MHSMGKFVNRNAISKPTRSGVLEYVFFARYRDGSAKSSQAYVYEKINPKVAELRKLSYALVVWYYGKPALFLVISRPMLGRWRII